MTDLEFIEKEIAYWTDEANEYKKVIYEDEITLKYCQLAIDKQRLKNAEIRLNHLQQIKAELEAWEICKNKLNLKVQTEEAVTEGFCMKGYWLLVEQYPYTQTTILEQEEYEILKKALEVKDE